MNAALLVAQQPTAADEMHAGVLAYKFSDYPGAAEHFRAALELNPNLPQARLFLATALAQQYIAGDDTPSNVAMAEEALDEFRKVLNGDPTEVERYRCIVPLASLNFNLKHFGLSREYYGQAIALKPDDAHNYFMLGLMDWMEASRVRTKTRSEMKLGESEMLSDPAACAALREANQKDVEDGIQRMQKALELQPTDGDALAYLNLLYRERAEYECDDADARKADLKTADEWVDKAVAAKKVVTEKPAAAPEAAPPPQ
jgi:tetratricopeptide (TPR) repeat protein